MAAGEGEMADRVAGGLSHHRELPRLTMLSAHTGVDLNVAQAQFTLDRHQLGGLERHAVVEVRGVLVVHGNLQRRATMKKCKEWHW